ncbi:unnamed protein product [Oppiella nova]|uniref:Serine hydrolase FSH domain-containing protein n=1 Tax=Oppiella nova TaxID=334625 RepID=A0A7R9QPK3_9ACAR|nr:unnamed protein product [Oppiella nova]CAG2169074.1 unnamed protein product [Oppiella nova]
MGKHADEKEVQDLWRRHMIFIANFPEYFPNGVCNKKYETIKCRMLIVHGDKDPLVEMKHPLHLMENIKTAELKRFPLGSHNLHRVYTKEFKTVVEDFFLNTCF